MNTNEHLIPTIVDCNFLTWNVIPPSDPDDKDAEFDYWHPCIDWLHQQQITDYQLNVNQTEKHWDEEAAVDQGGSYLEVDFDFNIKFQTGEEAIMFMLTWRDKH